MKAEELTALGVASDVAEKIVGMNAAELKTETDKTAAVTKELEAAKKNVSDISEKLKSFDGVDVEALKKSAADWEKKYNDDMKAAKMDSAVELALTKAGAKDVSLAAHLIDKSIIKEDDGKLVGLSEQLEKIRSEKAWLFEDKKAEDPAPVPTVNTGMEHGSAPAPSETLSLKSALAEYYKS